MSLYETLALGDDQFKKDRIAIEHEGKLIWDTDMVLDTPIIDFTPMSPEEWQKVVELEERRMDNF